MNISPLFLAIRAVSAEFAGRLYVPVVAIIGSVAVVVLGLLIWLVTVSGWWWLLLAPALVATLAFFIVAIIASIALSLLRPRQTKEQRLMIRSFVDSLQQVAETIQTPKFVLLFRLVKDTILPTDHGLIQEVSSHASSLRDGMKTIIASFQ